MKKFFTLLSSAVFSASMFSQVGIQTSQVAPSAILEISTNDLAVGNKKGFLPPRVALAGNRDTTTIPSPAVGLFVYNTANGGTFPNNVIANRYYYWNGTIWTDLAVTSSLTGYLADRILSLNSTSTQTFTYAGINATSSANGGIPVSFADGDIVTNTGAIASKSGDNNFVISITGLYEVTGFVNYNPNRTSIGSPQRGCFLNLKLQRSTDNGTTWTDIIGNRTAWGVRAANSLKTAILSSTPVYLTAGQQLRLVVQNPFEGTDTSSLHGETTVGSPLPAITTAARVPVSKSLTIVLLDYDLQ
ncbi:hypothetical protein [Chryseobacterium caseinilyticum]|uniref:Uncharacterized protein n=1 Tax=Chryseobacterium caseinilyticum TaxID=2771428 RepID=A0ABR8ZAD6_9FLAO|nr:hypothetical protein [Chryseobacterium caseinilyticum]MBD8082049.1 hypothetical protein [Chryseobacterium caseinilyticum]